MPRLSLIRHPHSPSPAAAIAVDVRREAPSLLALTYHIVGGLDQVAIPAPRPAARTDELWKHTCFEAFIAAEGYYEFNFSPSSQWAAYRFDGYRAGMRDAPVNNPTVTWFAEEGRATLSATISLPPDVTGPLGLSAVIEDELGARSFWALAHAPGPPDFHNAACFAAELPPAG